MLPRPVQPLKESSYAEGQSQTASQSEPLERATLLPGLSPGYVWLLSHITVPTSLAAAAAADALLGLRCLAWLASLG
jgi:hypothetical protein